MVLVALAIITRAGAVLVLQSHHVPRSTFEHGEVAANLLAGNGFSVKFLGAEGPTSQQAPLYPLIVTAAYALGGVGTPRALLLLEIGQAIMGGALVVVVIALAGLVVPERPVVSWAAGAIVALHPTLVYAATHVQVASLATVLLVATLLFAWKARAHTRARDAWVCGLFLGLTALTDPILALVAPGVAWIIGPTRPRMLGIVALCSLFTVAPWIARNYRVHHELVLIKSTFGYAFWQGNCALSEGTDKVVRSSVDRLLERGPDSLRQWNETLWAARHEAGYIDDIALTAADYQYMALMSEPERSRWLMRRALADLRAEPSRYPRLCLRRLRYFVFWDETNPKTRSLVYRTSQLLLTASALLGWTFMGPSLRKRWGPTALTVAIVALFHALTIVSARFHVPIEPLLALWAASGLAGLTPGAKRQSSSGLRSIRTTTMQERALARS